MIVLGIDPSIHHIGLAYFKDGNLIATKAIPITEFALWFQIFTYKQPPKSKLLVVIEKPPLYRRAKTVVASINAIKNTIKKFWQEEHHTRVKFIEVAPQSWRKAILGNGKANKEDAEFYVENQFYKVDTHHEAEAVCLALYGYNLTKGGIK